MERAFGHERKPEDIVVDMVTSKFNDINANIQKIFAWQQRAEMRIRDVEARFTQLKSEVEGAQHQIISRVHAYNDTMQDFRASVEAFDRLLGKLSPLVAQSVNDLDITATHMKSMHGQDRTRA